MTKIDDMEDIMDVRVTSGWSTECIPLIWCGFETGLVDMGDGSECFCAEIKYKDGNMVNSWSFANSLPDLIALLDLDSLEIR